MVARLIWSPEAGPYLILFETRPDTDEGPVDAVEVLRVVNGRRDLTNLV
jgi:toxin ParE1/3/4